MHQRRRRQRKQRKTAFRLQMASGSGGDGSAHGPAPAGLEADECCDDETASRRLAALDRVIDDLSFI
jgi:hypothetical protein